MEVAETPAAEEESLGEFVQKLQLVFDAVAEEPGGFLPVQRFIQMGLRFVEGDELQRMAELLDPHNLGLITFHEFCRGIFAINGCGDLLDKDECAKSSPVAHYHTQDGGYAYHQAAAGGSMGYHRGLSGCNHYPSDLILTIDHQNEHPESDMDGSFKRIRTSGMQSSRGEGKDGLSVQIPQRSSHCVESGHVSPAVSSLHSGEEQFEDYGEGDVSPGSPSADEEGRTHACSDLGSSLCSSAGQTPRRGGAVSPRTGLEVFCAQCSRRIDLLSDLATRLRKLKAEGSSRKLSSTAFGRQLFYTSNYNSNSSEDLFRDTIDPCEDDIAQKVCYLERKVSELENERIIKGDQKSKLKQENVHLVHRVHAMEEQLREQESRAQEELQQELRRQRQLLSRLERQKEEEILTLNSRAQQLEEESQQLRQTATRLKTQTQRLDQEHQRISYKLEETSLRLRDEVDLYRRMVDRMRQNRQEFQREREAMQELIEDLRRELEHLHLFKLDTERPGWAHGSPSALYRLSLRSRELELEHEVRRLRQENARLREQNVELNGQVLGLSLSEAAGLFQNPAQSLATEIDTASRDQLMEALRDREEINLRLRQYMDRIILAIIDHNPSILEIKK
ncbi:rab11 family-interacting protein 4B-like [Hemitrygon akajei]|uniref:rab11 family-interacting protein 4B-like n=2 Tax=Myliobatiformes TaxID=117851 RepID=UPI003BF95CAB